MNSSYDLKDLHAQPNVSAADLGHLDWENASLGRVVEVITAMYGH